VTRHREGLAAAIGAYVLWGLFPLYWPLLKPAAPVEILGHRMVWSLAFLVVVLAATSGFRWLRTIGWHRVGLLTLAAVLITINWGTFIYAVNSKHVVETSLGYFINPLVTVALAVLILHESLRRNQRIAVAIGAVAVLVLTIDYGRPPWIALTLAGAFATYGFVKKRADVDGIQSLAVETAVLFPAAFGYLLYLAASGDGTFTTEGAGHMALLAGAGVVTAVPLMLFGAAAIRIPLATVGLLQYIAPVMQFLIGVLVYGEDMPPERLAGFALVWVALTVFAVDAVNAARRGVPVDTAVPPESEIVVPPERPGRASAATAPVSASPAATSTAAEKPSVKASADA
jgi:chloramphenicol-sensitive protein RarD